MATFPTLPWQRDGSEFQKIDDLVTDEWPNGGARGRSFFQGTRYRWTADLYYLTSAQKTTLESFYASNKLITFDLVNPYDGATYNNVIFDGPVIVTPAPSGPYWNCIVKMRTR